MAVILETVLDKQRDFVAQTQLDLRAQACRLAEVDEVFQRKRQGDWLGQMNLDILAVVIDIGVLSE